MCCNYYNLELRTNNFALYAPPNVIFKYHQYFHKCSIFSIFLMRRWEFQNMRYPKPGMQVRSTLISATNLDELSNNMSLELYAPWQDIPWFSLTAEAPAPWHVERFISRGVTLWSPLERHTCEWRNKQRSLFTANKT